MILDYIKNDTLLIIPNNIKSKVLDSFNNIQGLYNVKIMTFEELKKHIYFDYDKSTIIYLMEKYNYKYDVSCRYINNLYYLNDNKCDDFRINKLISIKEELDNNNLLYYDNLFSSYIKDKNILVYGFDYINKFNMDMLNSLSNVEIIKKDYFDNKLTVYSFDMLNDEVEYVFYRIAELLHKGIDINKIKLSNVTEEYYYSINKISKYYNIPINLNNNFIYSTKLVSDFLKYISQSKNIISGIEYIKDTYDLTIDNNKYLYTSIINILNDYDLSNSFDKVYECIINDLKNKKNSFEINDSIEVISLKDNIIYDDEYVFLLGFNQNIIPVIYKDDDYISDNIKKHFLLETTEEKNKQEKEIFINIIKSINNICITYKLKSISTMFYPSNLIKDLDIECKEGIVNREISYSKDYDLINCAFKLDNLIKYGIKDNDLSLLLSNYDIPYLTYDNKYTNIDSKKVINKYKNKGLVLSYSHLDNYYHCSFKYYLSHVLGISKYDEDFNTKVGTFFHYILSICLNDKFNFDIEYDNYIKSIELNISEKFFIDKLKEELRIIINRVKDLHNISGFNKNLFEQKIYIDKTSIIPVTFMGIVDKIMYKEKEDSTYVSIVDYKTGSTDFDLKMLQNGLKLQLPIYLYLVSKSKLFKNIKFTGFYLQQILHGEVNIDKKKNYEETKNSNLRLYGYSTSDKTRLEIFDPTYEKSEFIKGMRLKKDGEFYTDKVISDKEIDNVIDLVDLKINEARDSILSSRFDINPKEVDGKCIGCDFCKYRDICFVTAKDRKKITIAKDLSFLGGDNCDVDNRTTTSD